MPKSVAAGCGARAGYDGTPAPISDAVHVEDARLVAKSAMLRIAGTPVQVGRQPASKSRAAGCLRSAPPLARYAVLRTKKSNRKSPRQGGARR